jgi:hypothetical protein
MGFCLGRGCWGCSYDCMWLAKKMSRPIGGSYDSCNLVRWFFSRLLNAQPGG